MKPATFMIFSILLFVIYACTKKDSPDENPAVEKLKTIGSIEMMDLDLESIVAAKAKIEILAEGHDWSEGPVWVPTLNSLLYSDIPKNSLYRWKEGEKASLWLKPSGFTGKDPRGGESGSNGLLLDSQGKLLLAQHGDRRIARLETSWEAPEANYTTLADKYDGKRFNSPNDLVQKSNGDIYFTDPPYGLEEGAEDPAKELDFQGVYRLATDGTVTLLTKDLSRPNGIGFSPDENILYVASSDHEQPYIMAYDVQEDGNITNGRVFFETWGDGMAIDQKGNVYQTGPGGVFIIAPDGKLLGKILTTQATSNCTFGEDGYTLFITADMYVLWIRLKTKGLGF
jgi:gluconolactonase